MAKDWIKCIRDPTDLKLTLCGKKEHGFCFEDITHAYIAQINEDRLIPCYACICKVSKVLKSQRKG